MDMGRYLRGIRAVAAVLAADAREMLDPRLKRERVAGGVVVSRRDGKPLRAWTEQEMRTVIVRKS